MALTVYAITQIAARIRGAKILCLGYPDILAPAAGLNAVFGLNLTEKTPYGKNHKAKRLLVDTEEFFAAMGAVWVEYVDSVPSRGRETQFDLNYPFPDSYNRKFDLVIDAGTIEHCANIFQALLNAAQSVAPGGMVYHGPPLSMVNHGFYNVCPTLLADFYDQNYWTLGECVCESREGVFPLDRYKRTGVPAEAWFHFTAHRRAESVASQFPIQTKYKAKS